MAIGSRTDAATLARAFMQMLGEDDVITAENERIRYAVDGITPAAVLFPQDLEQVSDILAFAHAENLAVIPRGAGTLIGLGNPPRRADVVISLARLNRVLEHEPADLTATAQAGIPLGTLQAYLARAGQWLPLDPPLAEQATIGGLLAANASGPQRLGYGTLRDLLIGLRVVGDDGTLFKGGAKVVKNVAGYDLPKLFVGSLGTLGIIVEATFKLLPLPKAHNTLISRFRAVAEATDAASRALAAGLTPVALEALDRDAARAIGLPADGWTLCARFAGIPAATERQTREMEHLARAAGAVGTSALQGPAEGDLWQRMADLPAALASVNSNGARAKISVLPTRLPQAAEAAAGIAQANGLQVTTWLRGGTGLAYVVIQNGETDAKAVPRLGATIAPLRERIATLGGTMVLEEAPVALKVGDAVWGPTRSDFRVMQAIKQKFDPKGILNPGRFVGGL